MATSILGDVSPSFMSAGPLVLDLAEHTLYGPAGKQALRPGVFILLRELLRRPGAVLGLRHLIETSWPDPDAEPDNPERAIRTRVYRAREALAAVGVPGACLESRWQAGYAIEGAPRVVRAFTAAQAAAVDAWAPSHPAFQAVA